MAVPIAVCLGVSLLSVFALIDGSSVGGYPSPATDGRLGAAILGKPQVRSLSQQHSDFGHFGGGGVKGGGGGRYLPTGHHEEQHYEHGHYPHSETSRRHQYSHRRLDSHAHPHPHTHDRRVNLDLSHTISSPGRPHPYHTHPDRGRHSRPRPHDQQHHYPLHPHRGTVRPLHYQEHSRQRVSSLGARRISGAGWYPSTELTSEVTDTRRHRHHHAY